ncbi:Protein Malvolio [Lucilia cuprina]|nr:Protein Malvolio [Lucilia cuprina]
MKFLNIFFKKFKNKLLNIYLTISFYRLQWVQKYVLPSQNSFSIKNANSAYARIATNPDVENDINNDEDA